MAIKNKVVFRVYAKIWIESSSRFFVRDIKSSSRMFLNDIQMSLRTMTVYMTV